MLIFCSTILTAAPAYKVLVLTERGGQHGGFTDAALKWLEGKSKELNFEFSEINNTQAINEKYLSQFKLIIQLDYPPYSWTKDAEKAFIRYIDEGQGGWIGFHHATLLGEFDGYPLWHWFSDFMGGIRFKDYIAAKADATVRIEDATHPVMKGVNSSFVIPDDEWYTFDKNPRPNVRVLANVDESTYKPASNITMGDHPVVWVNPNKTARNVYFLMGHSAELFDSKDFTTMFSNAIEWASSQDKDVIRLAFISGMHPLFDEELYAPVLDDFAGTTWKAYTTEESQELFKPQNKNQYDVIIFHDICLDEIPESTKNDIVKVVSEGKPVFILHDGLLTYNTWPEFANIAGMKYFMSRQMIDGEMHRVSTYKHNQEIPVTVVDKNHFITQGIDETFVLNDEIYDNLWQAPDIHVLWTTTHPESIKDVMYTHQYGKGKVVGIVMGHGPDIFKDRNFKLAFQRAILWLAN